MTRLSDAQYLELAVQCLEHARQSTAIRDCQCHTCKGFMQQSGELIEDIRKRGALETEPTLSERMRDAGFKSRRRAAIPDEPEGETGSDEQPKHNLCRCGRCPPESCGPDPDPMI